MGGAYDAPGSLFSTQQQGCQAAQLEMAVGNIKGASSRWVALENAAKSWQIGSRTADAALRGGEKERDACSPQPGCPFLFSRGGALPEGAHFDGMLVSQAARQLEPAAFGPAVRPANIQPGDDLENPHEIIVL